MYARVVTGQCQSTEKLDEAFQMYRDSIVPAAMQAQGFKGALGLADRSTGKIIAISLRETAADMQATESSGFLQEQFAKLIHLLAETPIVEVYEVSIQEMQQGVVGTYARVLTSTAQLSKMMRGCRLCVTRSRQRTCNNQGSRGDSGCQSAVRARSCRLPYGQRKPMC